MQDINEVTEFYVEQDKKESTETTRAKVAICKDIQNRGLGWSCLTGLWDIPVCLSTCGMPYHNLPELRFVFPQGTDKTNREIMRSLIMDAIDTAWSYKEHTHECFLQAVASVGLELTETSEEYAFNDGSLLIYDGTYKLFTYTVKG